jgi:hypothetical protein
MPFSSRPAASLCRRACHDAGTYERLRAELEQCYRESKLPEAPEGAAALNDLLIRIRLGNHT